MAEEIRFVSGQTPSLLYATKQIVAASTVTRAIHRHERFTEMLYVYQGADAAFTLYEDEGVNYNYEQGKYTMIPMAYNEAKKQLVIGDRKGEFDGMLKERTFEIIQVNADSPKPFDMNAKGIVVKYNGTSQTIQL